MSRAGLVAASREPRRRPAYPIASVDNALRLMVLFGDRQVLRLSEVSDALGVVRSTAHRLLAMLQHHGFVEQEPGTRAYVAGPALLDIGLESVGRLDLVAEARPVLRALTAELEETSHVSVLQGRNVVFGDTVESPQRVRTESRVGMSLPAHCTASGKAILAEMPLAPVALLYGGKLGAGLTARSISSFEKLEGELAEVRVRGWATNLGESDSSVCAVAAAIPSGCNGPRAALTVSVPLARVSTKHLQTIARAVLRGAERVGRGLAPLPLP